MTNSEKNPKSKFCRRRRKGSLIVLAAGTVIRHLAALFGFLTGPLFAAAATSILHAPAFSHYVERFNSMDDENLTNAIPNSRSWDWLQSNIPLFECPDREVEEMYYYRWWSFRKHIVQTTTNGFVLTEFLTPVRHAGAFNTISCAVGHHLAEGRWLRDQRYLDDYIRFWLRGNAGKPEPHFHKFSTWFADAIYKRYLVNHDNQFVTNLLDDLVADYRLWEQERRGTNGLFWQFDVQDGMEESISGSRTVRNLRPTINSYMFANARALSAIARLADKPKLAGEFETKASDVQRLTQQELWNPEAKFFEVRHPDGTFANVREELGFVPWCFNLPAPGYESAWLQLVDPAGFHATYGITTAERRHPAFRSHGCCKCEWDGAVWPFGTTQTLTGLANVLRDYSQTFVSNHQYFDNFLALVRCQWYGGKPYIGEYLDETTGQWLKGKLERSRYYNHSTFADLLITGLLGLCPREGDALDIQPLLPENTWNWFCVDGISYHGRMLSILWDRDGSRYHQGTGLSLLVNGKPIAHRDDLGKLTAKLP